MMDLYCLTAVRELTRAEVVDMTPVHAKYVIIGSGTAAYFAAVGIRRKDKESQVRMLCCGWVVC
jgi:hypothetical protein